MKLIGSRGVICSLLLAFALSAVAQQPPARTKPTIKRRDNRQITVSSIALANAQGDLDYVSGGTVKQRIKKDDYLWAWIPKPKEIVAIEQLIAAREFADAAEQARAVYDKYKFVGYDINLVFLESMCLIRTEQVDEAIARLKLLDELDPAAIDPIKLTQFYDCRKLLADLYIKGSQFTEAEAVLALLSSSDNDNLVAAALNARGEIFRTQGKKKDAVLMYLQTALLFPPENKERPRALLMVANLLKEMNDNRATRFAEMLQQQYPTSPLIKELK